MKIIEWLMEKLEKNGMVEPDRMDLYRYGFEVGLLKLNAFFLAIVFSLLIGEIKCLMVILIALVPIRKNAGGIHAGSRRQCLYYTEAILLILQKIYINRLVNRYILFGMILFGAIFIICFAPQDNEKHRLTTEQRVKLRKKTIYICTVEIAVFGISIYFNKPVFFYAIGLSVFTEALLAGAQLWLNHRYSKYEVSVIQIER